MAGGYINVGVNEIKSLPICDISKHQTQLCKIAESLSENPNDKVMLTHVDILVYNLYGLTYDEVLIVDPETQISRNEYESFNVETYGQP